ncbi:UDP-glucose 4-epimerase GalE [Moorella sp. E306M]|jgi:UDP-glucose 4-epimerase|uniref:UDP-glucose 4-epimerase GalE n=1 Tax=Moorella sp. E306M TaxID=2572683 RepID=UPI0010FFBCE9|nr:UDP-glucose 4-epimerase GalE [Moorella sp. E306M]GEA17101.1 UDP-glucose 4-epimerase GalE [Moorella sp. E306M]
MKPVLVTGGAGYIGSHTVQELIKDGALVVVLDNLSTGHLDAVHARHFYEGDIADTALVEHIIKEHGIKSVIHFAAKSLVGESLAKPELYFYENTVKSFMFFEAAVKAGVKHIVFSSTAAVYGIPPDIPIREETMLAPINPYGDSKRMIEKYLEWMGKVHSINWVALRYFNAAGASLDGSLGEDHRPETHLIPLVLQTALGLREKLAVFGTDYKTADGTCIRDYVHVVDLANAHILALQALEHGLQSGIFNVGTGKGYSVREIIAKSQALTGYKIAVEYGERRAGDPPVLVADSAAIKGILGWEPGYSDLETILSSAWHWHSTHPKGYRL